MPRKEKEYYEVEEAAEELGVSRMTIFRMITRGALRKFKKGTGKRIYISSEDIEKAKQYELET